MSAFLRLSGPAIAAAGLILGTLPAFAQSTTTTSKTGCSDIHFELANPSPGAMLEPGGLVIEGIASDARSTTGPGIDRIDFFLGNRDTGGVSVGSAVPGTVAGPFGPGSFQTTVTLPNITGGNDLFGYAHSVVTGQESIISVPIAIGENPTVAGETSINGATPTINEMCQGSANAQNPNAPTAPAVTPSTTTTTPSTTTTTTTPTQSNVALDVANPAPGATVLAGAYVIQGTAVDRNATEGVGIDRVDVFLDNRDEGGTFLGSASLAAPPANMTPGAWTVTVNLPSNMKGLHALWFYAHSTVSGTETTLQVPVTIQ